MLKDSDRVPVTLENVLSTLSTISSSERDYGKGKIPVMNVVTKKIEGGWIPSGRGDLEELLGIVGEYFRVLGRYQVAVETEEMLLALKKILEENESGKVRS